MFQQRCSGHRIDGSSGAVVQFVCVETLRYCVIHGSAAAHCGVPLRPCLRGIRPSHCLLSPDSACKIAVTLHQTSPQSCTRHGTIERKASFTFATFYFCQVSNDICELKNFGPTLSGNIIMWEAAQIWVHFGSVFGIAGNASSLLCNLLQHVCQSLCISCIM